MSQYAFISDISLLNVVLIFNEFVNYVRRKKEKLSAFKVDFEKASDSVSWNYLLYVIKRMNFGNTWINWICASICSNSLLILINGSPIVDF